MNDDDTSIALRHVHHAFGSRSVLNDVSVTFGRGVTGLLGPNGAGKTTLLSILATIAEPTSGELHYKGNAIRRDKDRQEIRRHLGFLPQNFEFFPQFTALETVEYIALLRGVPCTESRASSMAALGRVGLEDEAFRKVRKLSGGQQRRVGIAQAIVNSPSLLLLDETTVGLDPRQRIAFRHLIRDLGEDAAVVVSTHLVEDVAAACSRVVVLRDGELIFDHTPCRWHGSESNLATVIRQLSVATVLYWMMWLARSKPPASAIPSDHSLSAGGEGGSQTCFSGSA
jgi:ABC-2 type transport system ATP-binding protein